MELSGKVWGETQHVADIGNVSIHRISINPGGFCSKHRHAHKHNLFFVELGDLIVTEWMPYGLEDSTTLDAGQAHAVPPGRFHQFKSERGCAALEVYWTDPPAGEDIERESCGGVA